MPPKDEMGEAAKDYYAKYGALSSGSTTTTGGSYSGVGYSGGSGSYTFKKKDCKHWQVPITLAEGIVVHASAYRDHPMKSDNKPWLVPHVGAYFASSWDDFSKRSITYDVYTSKWNGPRAEVPEQEEKYDAELACIDWPDMNIPNNKELAIKTFEYLLNKAGEGEFVEIGCIGGHGRTGTAIAAMLILLGERDADTAMNWVWSNYCKNAIETSKQEDWLWEIAEGLYPDESPALHQAAIVKKEQEKAKSKKKDKKSSPLASLTGGSYKTSKAISSADPEGILDEDEAKDFELWWFKSIAQDAQVMIDNGIPESAALLEACSGGGISVEELQLFMATGEIPTMEDDEDEEYRDWQKMNEYIARSNSDEKTSEYTCGLCQQTLINCDCFDGGGPFFNNEAVL